MDILSLLANGNFPLELFAKIVVLIFLGFVIIYALILYNQVRSFRRVVSLEPASISSFPFLLTVVYLIAAISLFLIALVIL